MSKTVRLFFTSLVLILVLCIIEAFYLYNLSSINNETLIDKKSFTHLVGLPDLVISSNPFTRHRSLSDTFDIYSVDGALREYAPESYIISISRESK